MKKPSVLARLAALKTASMQELKIQWKELFEAEPPSFNRSYLESRLAYRIQELALGGISKETRVRMREMGKFQEIKTNRRPTMLTAGTMVTREWHGSVYKITVLSDGFEYQGRRYHSLSGIAREITGTNWNGHAFFGLRKKRA